MRLEFYSQKGGLKTPLYYGYGERDSLPRRKDIVDLYKNPRWNIRGIVSGVVFDYSQSEPTISILLTDIFTTKRRLYFGDVVMKKKVSNGKS